MVSLAKRFESVTGKKEKIRTRTDYLQAMASYAKQMAEKGELPIDSNVYLFSYRETIGPVCYSRCNGRADTDIVLCKDGVIREKTEFREGEKGFVVADAKNEFHPEYYKGPEAAEFKSIIMERLDDVLLAG